MSLLESGDGDDRERGAGLVPEVAPVIPSGISPKNGRRIETYLNGPAVQLPDPYTSSRAIRANITRVLTSLCTT